MTLDAPDGRAPRRTWLLALICAGGVLAVAPPARARLESWREESASAFSKGHREGVVVSDAGRVRLGQAIKPLGTLSAVRVWDLARGPHGDLYAATGDEGKVYKRDAGDDAPWTVAFDADDTQALALAVGPDGHLFVGTGSSGRVIDVTDPKHPSTRPDPGVQYVWDLAADHDGNLYAATGPTGQLWKRSTDGRWNLLYDSKQSHLLCVAVAADGSVYAGSDGEGLVYKVAPGGKVSVVYDAPQNEVRTLLVGSDGTVYAGTAAEAGGGPTRGPNLFPNVGGVTSLEMRDLDVENLATRGASLQEPPAPPSPPSVPPREPSRPRSSTPSTGASSSRTVSAGENVVYRIDREGFAREVFRAKVLIFALALQDDRLVVATGPEGQLYEVRDNGRESAPVARLDNGQILALLKEPNGNLLLGTGDPGKVARLGAGHVSMGTLVSDVHDAKLISRFGALSWSAVVPKGTELALQVRTGNVSEPDATWSDWSAEQVDPETSRADVPVGRFVQYRARFATRDPALTPELHSVSLRYQSANLPPEIAKLDVPDVSSLDGATQQTRLTFRWDVEDPNDDELAFTLHLKKEGWPHWIKIHESPIVEKSFGWDTLSVPSGRYRLRVTASDRPSNNPGETLTRERESDSFLVDHEAPEVTIKATPVSASVKIKDSLTRIVKAAYALDGGDWEPVFAEDGLFDTSDETLNLRLPGLKSGTHVLVVRATDAAGNVGTGDALIEVP